MGVVDEDGTRQARRGDHLHASLDAGGRLQRCCPLLRRNAQHMADAQRRQCVIHGEAAGDGDGHWDAPPIQKGVKGHAPGRQAEVLPPQAAAIPGAVAQHGAGTFSQQPGRPRVVAVADGGLALAKQLRLGIAVVLHGAVKVQMVPCKVGKGSHPEGDAPYPLQRQRMGGHLHHPIAASGISHLPQQAVDVAGLRGGALRLQLRLVDQVPDGAYQAHPHPQRLSEDVAHQTGGGGFAVGAGDAHHRQLPVRMAVEACADLRQRTAGVLHDGPWQLLHRLPAQDAHGPSCLGLGDVAAAILPEAGNGYEHVAGAYPL